MNGPVAREALYLGGVAFRRFIPMSSSSVINLAGYYVAETLAQMRAIVSYDFNAVCVLAGNVSPGDGGGGIYVWDQLNSDPDDPLITVRPDDFGGAGLWKKLI